MDKISTALDAQVRAMFRMARARFGPVISGYWMYEAPGCPACGGEVDAVRMDGKEGLSLNVYLYRPHGVLIGYLLCGRCAGTIHRSAARMPGRQAALHAAIERTLEAAYLARVSESERRRGPVA